MSDHNIVFVGDGGVGKTALLTNMLCGRFEKYYCATVGAEVHPMKFGNVAVNVWDVAGQDKYGKLREYYYAKADAVAIMFDVTHNKSYRNVEKWYNEVYDVMPDIPVVLIGNKCEDTENRKITNPTYDLHYFETSVRNNSNIVQPFEWLTQQIAGDVNM